MNGSEKAIENTLCFTARPFNDWVQQGAKITRSPDANIADRPRATAGRAADWGGPCGVLKAGGAGIAAALFGGMRLRNTSAGWEQGGSAVGMQILKY